MHEENIVYGLYFGCYAFEPAELISLHMTKISAYRAMIDCQFQTWEALRNDRFSFGDIVNKGKKLETDHWHVIALDLKS